MARKMWGDDEKHVYRAVVTVTYPSEWSLYGMAVGQWEETSHYGPYLHPGPAKAAVTNRKKEILRRWRAQARRNSELPMPIVNYAFESAELDWKPFTASS
jgi:hypothetical protein